MEYKQCNRCIMDNKSDKTIVFDSNGICNYCSNALKIKDKVYFPNEEGSKKLKKLIDKIKEDNKNNQYDCIMGISGGLDSSYLAYLSSVKWGLRILAVNIDDGFDTEISKRNIERISKFPNIDMKTIKIDKEQYTELIKAYMRASVPNITMPQDNILFANLYNFVKEYDVKTFLSGFNFALESILQKDNFHPYVDIKNIMHIQELFGKGQIDKLKFISRLKIEFDSLLSRFKKYSPLDYVEFDKNKSFKELSSYCGFEYYGGKHQENEFTKFALNYWMYNKFNVDIRSSYLSSMIVSGQITREEALNEYNLAAYDDEDMQKTIDFVLSKIHMTREEFEKLMKQPARQHNDYKTTNYNNFIYLSIQIVSKIFRYINRKIL